MLTSDVQFPRVRLRIRKSPTSNHQILSEPASTRGSPHNIESSAINDDVCSHLDDSVKSLFQSVTKLKIRNTQSVSLPTDQSSHMSMNQGGNIDPSESKVWIDDSSLMVQPVSTFAEEHSVAQFAMSPRQRKHHDSLVKNAHERGFQVHGKYVDSRTKISMRCPEKHDLEISPGDFKSGYGCAKCAGRCPVESRGKLYIHAHELGYKVLGTYISNHRKIQMQCPEKHYFEITPANFKSGHGCAQCAGKCPVQAKEQLYVQAQQRGFQVLGSYVDSCTKIQMQCPKKHVFEITPANFKSDHGCAQCTGQCPVQAREDLRMQAQERNYIVLGIYTNDQTKIQMQCREQHLLEITPTDFKSGRGCAKCAENCPIQAREQFYAQAQDRGFRVINPYVNNRIKVQMQCPEKHLFEIQPASFKNGHGCRVCAESAGEQLLRRLLTALQLPFESQYILPSLPNRKYDFAIIQPEKTTFIEWDGQQHFSYPNLFHKNKEEFSQGQELDILKTQEVINCRYQMIRIDYTWLKKSVEEIGQWILNAMESPHALIVSNSAMYMWLSVKIVRSTRPKLIISSCPLRV